MQDAAHRAVAIVGAGAVLPDARNVVAFWDNLRAGRYSITDVPAGRWDPALYYDPDPRAPDKTYSKIGGWVREFEWDPFHWRLPLPPRVVDAMDDTQKWAVICARQALEDYGYPKRPLNAERTAVILGNAMAGEKHYLTTLRVCFPEYARELAESASFAALPQSIRVDIERELHDRIRRLLPEVTEDSMPGELANCIAGRVANLFNFRGPNFVTDAACASAMAAVQAAVDGLIEKEFDVAVTGGVDHNMGASTFVKFCKIGALSATGSRPFAEGADGFVMGEGGAMFILKRLADAERDDDRIYAVIRGIGGSSDGRGKGITAPNPAGQKLAIERAWRSAGESPASIGLMEAHGTSTKVGDVVEVESMNAVLGGDGLRAGSIALGSVKSNIGHLKGAAGAAGLLKAALALRDRVLPPSIQCDRRNPDIDFARSPLRVNTELRPWAAPVDGVRRAGLSAFGFGGTNFHAVLEEHIPGRLTRNGTRSVAAAVPPSDGADTAGSRPARPPQPPVRPAENTGRKAPLRGALVAGADSEALLRDRVRGERARAAEGVAPPVAPPAAADLRAPFRIAIDFADAADLADKLEKAIKALEGNQPGVWKALRPLGVFFGRGPAPKVAFLYTGQGSQYANMFRGLRDAEPIVAGAFAEADRVMTPLLGKRLSDFIFVDAADEAAVARAEADLRQTAITQPAVLATDLALTRLLAAYGIQPDLTMGHSLGEYGALVAADALPFDDALLAVSARGSEMTRVSIEDPGRMTAVFAPIEEIERILRETGGGVVIANVNSNHQAVIGGASDAVERAAAALLKAGYNAVPLPVSHAFHTSIVAPASQPLRRTLEGLHLRPPRIPVVANVDGKFYPAGEDAVPQMLDLLARQIASPVQFIRGLRTLYDAGARVFVEIGPKKALQGFAADVLGDDPDVLTLFTNHPKLGDIAAFNQALCGLYAMGVGSSALENRPLPRREEPVGITGAALGLPGKGRVFDDRNVERILTGEQFIAGIPSQLRGAILDKRITRLVKTDNGGPVFEQIHSPEDVLKLAGRAGDFDPGAEFGIPADRLDALDRATQLAIGAGLDALRDAGIPLALRYKTTTKGTRLPDRWQLPEAMRDDTGVIFASAFPGCNSFAQETARYYADRSRREQLALLEELRRAAADPQSVSEFDRRIRDLRQAIDRDAYTFDRRFIFRILSMGHSQFAEYIGARGPNTQLNAACASTTQAVSVAEDWIRAGRCRRVVIVSADDVTTDALIEWMGAAFLASGAAATDGVVEDAALPFDRRRHGMILGMGAAALVVESDEAARERGVRPVCEVLSAVTANSAFHGTRLDPAHIAGVMEKLVAEAERRSGVPRDQMAERMAFISHETYTPARGGSAGAEVHSLRTVFGAAADRIVITNTKGFTGHAMAAGVEDVVAVKLLETGVVPPVANFKEPDPELGPLNLSKGGAYPVEYALRLGAGFGSQISMSLLRWRGVAGEARPKPGALGYANRISDADAWSAWLRRLSGQEAPELEIANRTLRFRDRAATGGTPEAPAEAPARIEQVEGRVLAIVSAKTGYPAEMLALDLDLEADLGVDTVKQAEVFAAIRETYGIARDPNLKLRDFPTLAHVIRFVHERTAQPTPPPAQSVKDRVLDIAAEKTGYPKDMLDLDLDLEADLGIDTVKQAEMFASIREAYGIARDPNLKLRDFPTLAHVIRFAEERSAPPASSPAETAGQAVAPVPGPSIRDRVLDIVAEKTGYPKDMLDLDLDLEADLGIDTVKQAEMFASIREAYGIARDPNLKLRDFPTLAHVIRFAEGRSASPASSPAETAMQAVAPVPGPSIKDRVLDIVAEKTGYPKDMLDLDLDLEADLGIDTVKQAEMFASIREAYGITRDPNLKLRDFPTLAHVIRFAEERSTPPASSPAETARQAVAPVPGPSIKDRVLDIVAEKTGYPKDMLDLDLDLEADLGIDTVKQAEMFASIREAYGIARDPNLKLRDFPTLAHVIRFAEERSAAPASSPAETARQAVAPVPVPSIKDRVLDIVAEKTGYPKDMLDLDLDLEADLGIDTVKQAEMFASIREAYGIARDPNLKLRDFPTLAHVIRFAEDRQGATAVTAVEAPVGARPTPASFDAAERVPRRVPVPVIRPSLTACKLTGVTFDSACRVTIMPDQGGVAELLSARLRELGVTLVPIQDAADGAPVDGIYWLPALDPEGDLARMDAQAWREAVQLRVKSLYTIMRKLYGRIEHRGAFLVAGTRLGGLHGYDASGAMAPLGGAVAGFSKAYKRERPDALVKVVDFTLGRAASEVAELLIEETLRDPGAVEIGRHGAERFTIGLEDRPLPEGGGMTLDSETVFVITGAAGSIVSAITADLASASGGVFYLLDLAPEPDPANPDLARFADDRDGLKRDLFGRIQARGERATPVAVEKELAALERAHAARTAIEAVRAAGGTARYFSVDLTDAEAVARVIDQIRKRSGRVDVLLHAAGLDRSRTLADKEPRDFDLVFDVKADGWFHLLHAMGDMPLRAVVAFSSIAGRFGNFGQTDYSAANDLLCKMVSRLRATRPDTRALAIDWTAWGGIGMATRGSIPRIMQQAGIDMLPPEAGIPWIRRELTAGHASGEIVVGQGLGILLGEWDGCGGVDADRSNAAAPLIGRVEAMGIHHPLTIETTLDPALQPFLYDHQIDGTAVLPGVMGLEAFAEAALWPAPGWRVQSIDDVDFLAPVKFYRNEPRRLTTEAAFRLESDRLVATCRLLGSRTLANQTTPQVTTHFTARVRLADAPAAPLAGSLVAPPRGSMIEAADLYRVYFHGPAYRVIDRAWWNDRGLVAQMASNLPPDHTPSDLPFAIDPRLIELCFQAAGVWEMAVHRRMGLPQHIDRVSFYHLSGAPDRPLYAIVTAGADAGAYDIDVADSSGARHVCVRGYRTAAFRELGALPASLAAEAIAV